MNKFKTIKNPDENPDLLMDFKMFVIAKKKSRTLGKKTKKTIG
jgi:hypothetical protein